LLSKRAKCEYSKREEQADFLHKTSFSDGGITL
jgi:hypothetical protein